MLSDQTPANNLAETWVQFTQTCTDSPAIDSVKLTLA